MSKNFLQIVIVLLVILLILCSAALFLFLRSRSQGTPTPPPLGASNTPSSQIESGPTATPGPSPTITPTRMTVKLGEGQAQPLSVQPLSRATQQPLSTEEVQRILTRVPTLPVIPDEQVDFKLPNQPLPPPRTGETQKISFPPAEAATAVPTPVAGALNVLRYSPEGEIPVAPFLSVTFDQPMVPLATLEDLAAEQVPVRIEPTLPGTWRWAGVKTLTFQYDSKLIDRFPKATTYQVTIPAGTRSATGGVLEKAVNWTFTTPPVKMTASYPNNQPQPQNPLFYIAFDQRIEPAAVLKTIQVKAGSQAVTLNLASQSDVENDPVVKNMAKSALEGRWLAFKASAPLPLDTVITITIGPGTPSAEGPLLTQAAQTYNFRTYAPLKVNSQNCTDSSPCRPLSPFYISFNNSLDRSAFKESLIKIDPELPNWTASASGNGLSIQGTSKGRTTYKVTLSKDLQDVFGQKLGSDQTLSFKVDQANPTLVGSGSNFVTLDPVSTAPAFPVYVMNYSRLDVQIYSVQATDWPEYQIYMRDPEHAKIPGRQVQKKTLPVESPQDTLTEVNIDLKPFTKDSLGHFVVIVQPDPGLFGDKKGLPVVRAWVQVTQIALDAFVDHSEMVIWASALKNGAPLAGVSIEPKPGNEKLSTGADGTLRVPIPNGATHLIASKGSDRAILPRSSAYWSDASWSTRPVNDTLRWYVFDDRKMYKPGEEVHLKGWLRRIGGKQNGDVELVGSAIPNVRYRITEPQGNEIGSGRIEVNSLGGFDLAFKIPDKVNLGNARIQFDAEGSTAGLSGLSYAHNLQIQEFRRPEFEVNTRTESIGPFFAGKSAVLAVEASYYAGGPLPNAETTWQITSTPTNYNPPNWPDFTFGSWTPWFYLWSYEPATSSASRSRVDNFTGRTDAAGTHYLNLEFGPATDLKPLSVSARATVMDVNRQAWTDSTSLLVHPADLYVGLRSDRYFVERGMPLKIEFIVTDLDGKPAIDRPVEIRTVRLEWKYRNSTWTEEAVDEQICNQGSSDKPGACTFQTPVGGSYRITATISDASGRKNQTQITRWVSGGQRPPSRKVEQEKVTLIPDKETYQPGDTAQILVQSPFSPAEGLLTVSRSGILTTERFKIEKDTYTLKVPVEEKHIPNLYIQVDLTGAAPRLNSKGEADASLPARPAYASGQLNLKVPPLQRTLALKVTPEKAELEPGKATTVGVNLKNAAGQPVAGAEVAVVVVDEAILALTNYKLQDPIQFFYTNRGSDVSGQYGRASILLVDPQKLAEEAGKADLQAVPSAAPMATQSASKAMERDGAAPGMGGGEGQAAAIQVRSDFNPLAVFAPSVRTDANGEARVEVKLPDNLTRYRIMAVAVEGGKQFGVAESNLVARLPLMVRPSAPRFLNFGDVFELPVVLQNLTAEPLSVDVVLRTSNLTLTESQGYRVTVPARDRIEVRFPAAAEQAGTARFQAVGTAGEYADAATVELPVYTPATTEAFATYGVIDNGAIIQPVLQPKGVFPQFGGLEVSTSSTSLQALTDAVLYLVNYPYECSEQLASRILGVAGLRDVLTAFQTQGLPSPAKIEEAVQRDITRLQGLQNTDGGFPYWQRGKESIPFNTIHVAHALQRAKAKGYTVPAATQQRLLEYLRQIESKYPAWYSQRTRQNLSAYALYVRNLMGDRDPNKALKLLNDAGLEKMDLDALGWIWQVLLDSPSATSNVEAIRKHINNRVVETAGAANFTTSYDEQSYLLLNSDRRTDAILLETLILDQPKADLIPKLVTGLLAHQKRGRWSNTQENVFVLLALDKYFNTYEAVTPDFVARLWLGSTYAGSYEFKGRSTERQVTTIPMSYLLDTPSSSLILNKEGSGRLYYRLGLNYAPDDLVQKPLDMGFVVQRSYEGIDNPADVRKDENGVWHIKAGAKVRVRLSMVADNRRYHVALVDPLPAGLEIINPALAPAASIPQDPKGSGYRYGWWWWSTWFEHQNLRDDRAEAFTSLLWDGVYSYTYNARATTPGKFVVPAAKAEEMYSPEVFGRSASDIVIVE